MEVGLEESLVLPFTSHFLLFVTVGLGEAHIAGCLGDLVLMLSLLTGNCLVVASLVTESGISLLLLLTTKVKSEVIEMGRTRAFIHVSDQAMEALRRRKEP